MPGISRVSDLFTGYYTGVPPGLVTGMMVTGSSNVMTNGLGTCRVGDVGVHPYGPAMTLTGSTTVFVNGLGVSRIGDVVVLLPGVGGLVTGSSNTTAG